MKPAPTYRNATDSSAPQTTSAPSRSATSERHIVMALIVPQDLRGPVAIWEGLRERGTSAGMSVGAGGFSGEGLSEGNHDCGYGSGRARRQLDRVRSSIQPL